jgi:hypothetical protein
VWPSGGPWALGVVLTLLPKVVGQTDAPAWYATHEANLRAATRCHTGASGNPVDACPDCRAGRTCPALTWPAAVAAAHVGVMRGLDSKTAGPWVAPEGRLAQLATTGHRDVAAEAAWVLIRGLDKPNQPMADATTELAASLGLIQPQITHRAARQVEATGDGDAALARIDSALAHRPAGSHEGWDELTDYRAAVAARKVAAARANVLPKKHRPGHSAPRDLPVRRRFQLPTERPNAAGRPPL